MLIRANDLKMWRLSRGLSQLSQARAFNVSASVLRAWEGLGYYVPHSAIKRLEVLGELEAIEAFVRKLPGFELRNDKDIEYGKPMPR